jgi:hypothetical protein
MDGWGSTPVGTSIPSQNTAVVSLASIQNEQRNEAPKEQAAVAVKAAAPSSWAGKLAASASAGRRSWQIMCVQLLSLALRSERKLRTCVYGETSRQSVDDQLSLGPPWRGTPVCVGCTCFRIESAEVDVPRIGSHSRSRSRNRNRNRSTASQLYQATVSLTREALNCSGMLRKVSLPAANRRRNNYLLKGVCNISETSWLWDMWCGRSAVVCRLCFPPPR